MAIGQVPEKCFCHLADGTLSCDSRGCSVGSNDHCKNGYIILHRDHASNRNGCNCPKSTTNMHHDRHHRDQHHGDRRHKDQHHGDRHGHHTNGQRATHNGYVDHIGYHYETCTTYGKNARDSRGHLPATANAATNCCNYCCGRNDPQPFPSAPSATPTNAAFKILLNNSLCVIGLFFCFLFCNL